MTELLTLSDLRVQFDTADGVVDAVDGASLSVSDGQVVGLVGESGSGKSVTAASVLGLQSPGKIRDGRIVYRDTDLTAISEAAHRDYRGTEIGLVPQDVMSTLNPAYDVGEQIAEALRVDEVGDRQRLTDFLQLSPFSGRAWRGYRRRAVDLLAQVGISDPAARVDAYPHELSGGMRQRVLLAMALAGNPDLLIADEPTTGLDTTTQANILDRLRTLADERDTSLLVITHDLNVVAEMCDRTVVMNDGETVEAGPTERVLQAPEHPYTAELLSCRLGNVESQPSPTAREAAADGGASSDSPCTTRYPDATGRCANRTPVIETAGLSKVFDLSESLLERLRHGRRTLRAVDNIDLAVYQGETLGIVGESGSGKSTVAKLLAGLSRPTDGAVRFDGDTVGTVTERTDDCRSDIGFVFQDAGESINPRQTVRETIAEPLLEQGWEKGRRDARVQTLLDRLDLPTAVASRRSHQLSGGQRQRVALARALALEPRVLILDEPTTGLDASTRSRLLDVLDSLQRRLDLTYVVISHDLDVVRHLADRVLVMYLGRVVERGPAELLFDRPSHPYTAALVESIPPLDGTVPLEGEVPSAVDPPGGCAFHTRCPKAEPECVNTAPESRAVGRAETRCHFADAVADGNRTSQRPDCDRKE